MNCNARYRLIKWIKVEAYAVGYPLMTIELHRFTEKYFDEYRRWFIDKELNKALGPAWSKEELSQISEKKSGCEWVAIQGKQIVGVIGVCFPIAENPTYVITNLAVNPNLKRNGVGRKIVELTVSQYPLKDGESWVAFVDVDNLKARRFFEALDWQCISVPPANNNMYMFKLTKR